MKNYVVLLVLSFFTTSLMAQSAFKNSIVEEEELILSKEVFFDFGKYEIRSDADSTLQEVLTFCKGKEKLRMSITAHTDAIGSNENNLKLSSNRSETVLNYLTLKGLAIDSIAAQVFGEEKPIANNSSDLGRQQNRRATIDIFQQKKRYKIKGTIKDKETGKGIIADVIIRTKNQRDSLRTDTTGQFESYVPMGAVVGLEVYSKGYFLESKMMKALPGKMPDLNIFLPPLKKGAAVDINNLYFKGGLAVLLRHSEPELPKILKFMNLNSGAKIEIAGHVNFPNRPRVSTSSAEYDLSLRRAKLVYDYLIENDIPAKRISFKGYGNWEMRFPKARTEILMAKNRRVEIRVLELK